MNGVVCFKNYEQRDIFFENMRRWLGQSYFYTDSTLPVVRFVGLDDQQYEAVEIEAPMRDAVIVDSVSDGFM